VEIAESRGVMERRVLALVTILSCVAAGVSAAAAPTLVRTASSFGISRPVVALAARPAALVRPAPVEWERENRMRPKGRLRARGASADAALEAAPMAPTAMPSPALTFEGLSSNNNVAISGTRPIPPDPVGDVGPNHYVQMVNTLVGIYSKSGTLLVPYFAISDLFDTIGPPCAFTDDGDPIVLYDPLADRWLLSQLCGETTAGFEHELIAISTTGDPTGTYFVYDFVLPNEKANDYPHFGVWPDGYYMTNNQFVAGSNAFAGGGAYAFDRSKMLAGDPTASYIYFDEETIDPDVSGQLPSDLDGVVLPSPGTPNLFIDFRADEFGAPADALRIFEFHADFANPPASTFTARLPDVPLAAFDPRDSGTRDAITQPPPAIASENLDSLAGEMMHRIAYRTLSAGAQSFVLNFMVNVSGQDPTGDPVKFQAGIRWVELRRNAATGAVTVLNQGTYAPGAGNGAAGRDLWLGSVAQDSQGNLALGFSASCAANPCASPPNPPSLTGFPSILYAGRLAGDPAGSLAQGEAVLQAGGGSQQNASNRWGDYSAMSVDPSDECTFWYTNEYYASSGSSSWQTRVGAFKYPGCVAQAKGSIQGTVTVCGSGVPLTGVALSTPEGYVRASDGAGGYAFSVAPGTYTVTARKAGYQDHAEGVTVAGGGTVTSDFCMTAVPVPSASSWALQEEECPPPNGAIDPGETVTVNLCVANLGAAAASNLVGTLQATGGVASPSGPQAFGAVAAGGGTVCRAFRFRASGSCGSSLAATLALQDGATGLGTVTFELPLGAAVVPLAQDFDGVAAPSLPAGWTASNGSGATLWKTATSNPDTLPNSAFVDDPSGATDKRLTSPAFAIQTASARVTFRQSFALDEFFDGGVLEVSSPNINGGAFTDVTNAAVGGSFASGGYSGPLETGFGNPIQGRPAWTGNSYGYFTTVADLGPNVAGQTIQLRWRLGTDSSFGGSGWWVDSVSVSDGFSCCVLPAFVGQPMAVDAHAAPGTSSNVDGVLEPGESVLVSPAWKNTGAAASALTGSASAFTGPSGAIYSIGDAAADYGTIPGGGTRDCDGATGNCDRMSVSSPGVRPASHWDASFLETLSAGLSKTWVLHLGDSFIDVPRSQPFYRKIETLFHSGITAGCGTAAYCPDAAVPRSQMAIFLARGIAGSGAAVPAGGTLAGSPYFCGAGGVSLFADVSPTDAFCKHVHYIALKNVTQGCGSSQYCPSAGVSREEMAAFIARAVEAPGGAPSVPLAYGPDPVTGFSYSCNPASPSIHFTDVPASDSFCRSVHFLWAKGIVAGCSPTTYCPSLPVTRDQMAKFLSNAFGLVLYGP
jgi:hypothetical protein